MKYKLTLADDNGIVLDTYVLDTEYTEYSYCIKNMNDMYNLIAHIITEINKDIKAK